MYVFALKQYILMRHSGPNTGLIDAAKHPFHLAPVGRNRVAVVLVPHAH